jgi:outer membrane protein, heavy metal efflux system
MVMRAAKPLVIAILVLVAATAVRAAPADPALGATQLVEIAVEVNPQIKAAHARWQAAVHSIRQNYAPADPVIGLFNTDSATNGITQASVHTLTVTQSFQFPGKALLQADQAKRSAAIARLQYNAVIRDTRAAIETAFYQALLDGALAEVQGENIENLEQVVKVTQVAYAANQVTQTDFISAEIDLASARQQQRQLLTAEANDHTTINQLIDRPPDEPLLLDRKIALLPLEMPLDKLIDRAAAARQEILATALAESSANTALDLAKLEYAPDYAVGYIYDHYLLASAAPSPTRLRDHGFNVSFNVPIFYWLKQAEDVRRAGADLEAARDDLSSIHRQTAASVTMLYRNAGLASETAALYRDSLIPLARQDFAVALVAYQSGKIDFTALAGALRRDYDTRVAYLQAANQFLATRVALEQAIGAPLAQ